MAPELVLDRNWEEIPYFRRSWFVVLMLLVFMPAVVLLTATGDVYFRRKGQVYRFDIKMKRMLTFVSLGFMLTLALRHIH